MGELLLKGWTMLGSSCEECFVPLMRNKQMDELCVVCERNYRKDLAKKQQAAPAEPIPQAKKLSLILEAEQHPVQTKTREAIKTQNFTSHDGDLNKLAKDILQGKVRTLLLKLEAETDIS